MVAMILPILTVLCLVELNVASGISESESQERGIEKKSQCSWSHFGSRFNSLETDLLALTHKVDALTVKMDAQANKMDKALNRKECPAGFNYLPEVDQCLKLNTDKLTWGQAHEACRRMAQGGHMVAITDSAKQDAVRRYLEKQFQKPETAVCIQSVIPSFQKMAYIGGQRRIANRCDTPFVWKYKPGVEVPFAFTKWAGGQPDCGGPGLNVEHCVHLASGLDYGWNDLPCSWAICSVCEI